MRKNSSTRLRSYTTVASAGGANVAARPGYVIVSPISTVALAATEASAASRPVPPATLTVVAGGGRSGDAWRLAGWQAGWAFGHWAGWGGQEGGVEMPFQVVHGVEGAAQGVGQGLAQGEADQEGADQAGTAGGGDEVQVGDGDAGGCQGGVADRQPVGEVLARGDFGDDAAVVGGGR